ncbi:MAG: hypothetical protein C0594_10765 [Marinilabiliales bacterium]|nr:MAG: hypothetical protein C0594_10765 [Marinilabiliales bacterium]
MFNDYICTNYVIMRHSIFIFFLLVSSQIFAQIPNADFEQWETDGDFQNPTNWDTSNRNFFGIISFTTVTKETSAYSGSYCPKLETVEAASGGQTVKVAGILTLGSFDVDLATQSAVISGGISYTARPEKLRGYYKYLPQGIDSCGVVVNFYKWNGSSSDIIGQGQFVSGIASDWTLFECPISFSSQENPDSMNIVISSSDTSIFNVGSTLWVDSLTLTGGTASVGQKENSSLLNLFPQPAENILNVSLGNNQKIQRVVLYSIIGNMIKAKEVDAGFTKIDVGDFPPGVYIIQVDAEDQTQTRRIVIN